MKALLAAVAACALTPVAAAAQTAAPATIWEPSVGFDYSRGGYGAAIDTEVFYAPLNLRAYSGRWRFDAAVPYLRVRGPAGAASGGVVIPGAGPSTTRSGLGDITLGAAYQLNAPVPGGDVWEVQVGTKLATADDDLGTGEADYNVALNYRRPVTDKLTLTAGVGYQWLGDPAAYELEDGLTATAGFNYAARPTLNLGMIANFRSAYFQGLDDQISVTAYGRRDFASRIFVLGYAGVGLTDYSPDFNVGFQLGRRF